MAASVTRRTILSALAGPSGRSGTRQLSSWSLQSHLHHKPAVVVAPGEPLPATMRAVVCANPGPEGSLAVDPAFPVPAVGAGDVAVRVHATSVCYRDVLDRTGAFPFIQRPAILGHEIAGVIVGVGSGVNPARLGQKVVSLHWAPCGTCAACVAGATTECSNTKDTFIGLRRYGGYADFVVNGSSAFVPAPATGWSAIEAAPVMGTFGTVWHGAVTRGKLTGGETILINGASGGVGSAAVILAAEMGCRVIAVTSSPRKIKYLEDLGAHHVIVSDGNDIHKQDAVRQYPVDMVFEAVGAPTFLSGMRSLRRGGRLVLVGNVTNDQVSLPLGYAIINGIHIIGSDSITPSELSQLFHFLTVKRLRPVISSVLPLEQAADAHKLLESRAVSGRIVMDIGGKW